MPSAHLYEELLPLLINPDRPKADGEVRSWCPIHEADGKHANPDLTLSPDGRGLKCWAGCTDTTEGFKAVIDALYARSGNRNPGKVTGVSELRPGNVVPRFLTEKYKNVTLRNAYEYRDPYTQELVAVKARFEWPDLDSEKGYGKTFLWRLPDGTYSEGFKGKYQLTDMPLLGGELVAERPDEAVWLVEGEEVALALRAVGKVAVCGGWGATQREFGHALDILKGRDILLCPDNDVKGRELMANYRKALVDLGVKSVRVISPPVKAKEDIFDYLRAGGAVSDLEAGIITQPIVDLLALDRAQVKLHVGDSGAFSFLAEDATAGTHSLDCQLTIDRVPGGDGSAFKQRLNLWSASSKRELARDLANYYETGKETNWTQGVNSACTKLISALQSVNKGKAMKELRRREGRSWLVETIIPEGDPVIFFGDGGSGKTFSAYSIGVAVALGASEWCGFNVQQGSVLVVDYETSEESTYERIRAMLPAFGGVPEWLDHDMVPIYRWDGEGYPLAAQVDGLTKFVRDNNVKLIIIDSVGDAVSGDPSEARVALEYFNALRRICGNGASSITIAHISHQAANNGIRPDTPFGSRFFKQRARRMWYIERSEANSGTGFDIGFWDQKYNDGPRSDPLAFHLDLGVDGDAITMTRKNYSDIEEFARESPLIEQIVAMLRRGPATVKEISEYVGSQENVVRATISRGRKDGKFTQLPPNAEHREIRWALLERNA